MFQDTIFQFNNGNFIPKFVFDFGKYAQDSEDLKKITDIMERVNFMNNSAKLYFRGRYLISEKQLYTLLVFEKKAYQILFDRIGLQSHVIEGRLVDDIDGGYDPFGIQYHFEPGKVGVQIPGKDLYQTLMEKKELMGQEDFENWINNKGENFAKTALAARQSENPILIVYTIK